jgi:hypothetical protein
MIMKASRVTLASLGCSALFALASGSSAFAQSHPQSQEDLQPGVNTSAMPPQPAAASETAAPASMKPADNHAASSAAANAAPKAAPASKAAHPGKALDRLDLDTTQITGNKELPKVMYVVPWKHADLGDLTGKPANSLVDEVLQPVDRDVFNREERYYHTVAAEKVAPDAPSGSTGAH